MYPDQIDVKSVMSNIGLTGDPEKIWRKVNLAYHFLNFAAHRCHNHGKHEFIPAEEIKSLVETWTGGGVDDVTFIVAARFANLRWRGKSKVIKQVDGNLVKFPPYDRLIEFRDLWKEEQRSLEAELETEIKK